MTRPARFRVGVWNLEKQPVRSPRGAAQAEVTGSASVDLWLLTEVPDDLTHSGMAITRGRERPGEPTQRWTAIASRWPLQPVEAVHPTLVMALVDHPLGEILAATSVLPWRGAAASWPDGDGPAFAERFTRSLDAHASEIAAARDGRLVLWGGTSTRHCLTASTSAPVQDGTHSRPPSARWDCEQSRRTPKAAWMA